MANAPSYCVCSIVAFYTLNPYSMLSMPSSLVSDVEPGHAVRSRPVWGAWADLRNRFRVVGRP